jgi:hypothetical protein
MRNLTTRQARAMARKRKTHGAGYNGRRPRSTDRCPCGTMTRYRALRRRHVSAGGAMGLTVRKQRAGPLAGTARLSPHPAAPAATDRRSLADLASRTPRAGTTWSGLRRAADRWRATLRPEFFPLDKSGHTGVARPPWLLPPQETDAQKIARR